MVCVCVCWMKRCMRDRIQICIHILCFVVILQLFLLALGFVQFSFLFFSPCYPKRVWEVNWLDLTSLDLTWLVWLDSTQLDSTRLDLTRLDSTRLDSFDCDRCVWPAMQQAGRVTCSFRPCPVLNCPDHALFKAKGERCPKCKGQQKNRCRILYTGWEIWVAFRAKESQLQQSRACYPTLINYKVRQCWVFFRVLHSPPNSWHGLQDL